MTACLSALLGVGAWVFAANTTVAGWRVERRPEVPSSKATGGWSTNRAATFAIRAVAHAGLLDPTGVSYDYVDIQSTDSGWTAFFEVWDCRESVELGRCVRASTDSAFLDVAVEDDTLLVSETTASLSAEQRDKIMQYREQFSAESPGFEFPYVELTKFDDTSLGVQGSPLWTGPIPYNTESGTVSQVARCEARVFDDAGDVIFTGSAGGGDHVELEPPSTEEMRSGGVAGVPVSLTLPVNHVTASIVCSLEDAPAEVP